MVGDGNRTQFSSHVLGLGIKILIVIRAHFWEASDQRWEIWHEGPNLVQSQRSHGAIAGSRKRKARKQASFLLVDCTVIYITCLISSSMSFPLKI